MGRWNAVVLGRERSRGAVAASPPGLIAVLPRRGHHHLHPLSDQHSTYGTKVIATTWREAVAVLDEIFGNPTDLAIAEHTTDTAGQTLAMFAIFNLAGLQFPHASADRPTNVLPPGHRDGLACPIPARRAAALPSRSKCS